MSPPSDDRRLPDGTRVGRVALRVADRERVADFYRRVVGLDVLRGAEAPGRDDATVALGVDGTPLLVLADADGRPARRRAETGLYHAAFRVPSRAALGDALARVRADWTLDGAADHRVSEALYLADPAGNGVEIYRDRPRDAWPTAADGTVEMTTDPLALEEVEAAATGESRAPPGTDVGHVHLEVASLSAFEAFYVDDVGFDLRATMPGARFVAADGYHHHLGGNAWRGRTTPGEGRGLAWFELVVPTPDALESLRTRLETRDASIEPTDDGFVVADPDGNAVRFRAER